jgi:hypothetical protein
MKTWIPDARQFAYLTWKQADALPRERTLLVLPTAAIEQHGHHLPLATDTLINNLVLGKALAQLPAGLPIFALPPVCYGKSNEHIGFAGTLSVSAGTFMAVLRDLGASLAAAGFQKLCLYNTHGGNTSLVDVMARDLRAEFGLRTFTLFGSGGAAHEGISAQGRGRDRLPAPRNPGAGASRRVHQQLHRARGDTRAAQARGLRGQLRLAHPGHRAQRSSRRSHRGNRGKWRALVECRSRAGRPDSAGHGRV